MTTSQKLEKLVNGSKNNLREFLTDLMNNGYCRPVRDYKSYGIKSYLGEVRAALESENISFYLGNDNARKIDKGLYVVLSPSYFSHLDKETAATCKQLTKGAQHYRAANRSEMAEYARLMIVDNMPKENAFLYSHFVVADGEILGIVQRANLHIVWGDSLLYGIYETLGEYTQTFKAVLKAALTERYPGVRYELFPTVYVQELTSLNYSENNKQYVDFEAHLKSEFKETLSYWSANNITVGEVKVEKEMITNPAENGGEPYRMTKGKRTTWIEKIVNYLWPYVKQCRRFTVNGKNYLVENTKLTLVGE